MPELQAGDVWATVAGVSFAGARPSLMFRSDLPASLTAAGPPPEPRCLRCMRCRRESPPPDFEALHDRTMEGSPTALRTRPGEVQQAECWQEKLLCETCSRTVMSKTTRHHYQGQKIQDQVMPSMRRSDQVCPQSRRPQWPLPHGTHHHPQPPHRPAPPPPEQEQRHEEHRRRNLHRRRNNGEGKTIRQ